MATATIRGTIIAYRDDDERPQAEVQLANGDRVLLTLDDSGVSISQVGVNPRILFAAGPTVVSHLCASFIDPKTSPSPKPLQVLVAVVLQFDHAADVECAFRDAAAQVS